MAGLMMGAMTYNNLEHKLTISIVSSKRPLDSRHTCTSETYFQDRSRNHHNRNWRNGNRQILFIYPMFWLLFEALNGAGGRD